MSRRDDLGVEDEADIMANQSGTPAGQGKTVEHRQSLDDEPVQSPVSAVTPSASSRHVDEKPGVSRLSAKEVESISKNLYGNQSFLSEQEKRDLLKKVDASTRPSLPQPNPAASSGDPVDRDSPRSKSAKRVRGIAWFYRNWIQVVGENDLREHDEIIINDRPYLLRKKRFSPKTVIVALSPIAAVLLFFVGSAITPSISGKGRIVGVVTNQYGQPLSQPASVRIPELGQTITTNGQGLFVSNPIKSGSHKVEFIVDGVVVGTDYATVVSGEITTVKLAPKSATPVSTDQALSADVQSEPDIQRAGDDAQSGRQIVQRPVSKKQSDTDNGSDLRTTDPNARLLLDADVEGATLSLNDRVVGAGNLTYARLKPGRYDYEVSKDGYKPVKGTVDLSAGKTTSLSVQFSQQKSAPRPTTPPEEQHYQAAMAAVNSSDHAAAEQEFALAIQAKPSYTAAYMGLADLKSKTGRPVEASQDYLRAAEIYRVAGDLGNALRAYNSAVQTDKTSTGALLGRGNLYLARGEEVAALADFEQVTVLDRRNAQGYFGLGLARYHQGNPGKAIKHFKDARSVDSKNADVHGYLMLCYFATDDLKNAKKSYEDFMDVANDTQVNDLKQNPKFGAVLRVVE
jgi:Tfp pilus assembly protein PilF